MWRRAVDAMEFRARSRWRRSTACSSASFHRVLPLHDLVGVRFLTSYVADG